MRTIASRVDSYDLLPESSVGDGASSRRIRWTRIKRGWVRSEVGLGSYHENSNLPPRLHIRSPQRYNTYSAMSRKNDEKRRAERENVIKTEECMHARTPSATSTGRKSAVEDVESSKTGVVRHNGHYSPAATCGSMMMPSMPTTGNRPTMGTELVYSSLSSWEGTEQSRGTNKSRLYNSSTK